MGYGADSSRVRKGAFPRQPPAAYLKEEITMDENEAKASPDKSIPSTDKPTKKFHAWVQSIGIIIGSVIVFLWGVTAFIYKEIWLPKSAPVNVTLEFVLQKSFTGDVSTFSQPNVLVPIELRVSARNPSTRTVNLLPSIFIIKGIRIAAKYYTEADLGEQLKKEEFDNNSKILVTKYTSGQEETIVAVGNLMCYDFLYPNEIESRSFIFHIPQGQYDMLSAFAFIPSAADPKHTKIQYDFVMQDGKLVMKHHFYRPDSQGKRERLKVDDSGEYDKKLGIQAAETTQMISLW